MLAESLAAEAAREIERLLGADATQTLGDFEAAETAVRTAVLAVAARFVAERLNADHSDQHAAGLPCGCGHTARYAGRRAKTIRTALGAMTLERATTIASPAEPDSVRVTGPWVSTRRRCRPRRPA